MPSGARETQGRAPSGTDWITILPVRQRRWIVVATSLGLAIGLGAVTGLAFEPKRLTVDQMMFTGRAFEPRRLTVAKMTFTGAAFAPKQIAVGAMALTGTAFEPKRIDVGEMTITGLRP
jgi:hypothetical protein